MGFLEKIQTKLKLNSLQFVRFYSSGGRVDLSSVVSMQEGYFVPNWGQIFQESELQGVALELGVNGTLTILNNTWFLDE